MPRLPLTRKEIIFLLKEQGLHGKNLRKCCREFEQYQKDQGIDF